MKRSRATKLGAMQVLAKSGGDDGNLCNMRTCEHANMAEYYARLIVDAHVDYGVLEEEKPLLDKSIAILFGSGKDAEKRKFLKELDEAFSEYEEFIDKEM